MPTPISSAYTIASGAHLQLGVGTPSVTHALTLIAADTATVAVPFAISITNTGTSPEIWSITPPANVTLSDSTGLIWPGDTTNITGTASVANTYTLTLVCPGATITGNGQSVVVSLGATNPTPFRLVRTNAQYAWLKNAVEAAQDGDVIKCLGGYYPIPAPAGLTLPAPGNYVKPPGFLDLDKHDGIGQLTLTIEWETPGEPMIVDCSGYAAWENSRGGSTPGFFMGYGCRNLTIRGIHYTGSRAYGNPQHSGIFAAPGYPGVNTDPPELHPAAVLTVEDCKFVQCSDGILTNGNSKLVVNVRRTVFEDCTAGDAYHHIYAGSIESVNVEGSTFLSTAANGLSENNSPAHHLKSRARTTTVTGSLFGGDGIYACAIELPNGGTLVATGNIINHNGTVSASNENAPIRYGAEQMVGSYPSFDARVHSITLAQNTIRKAQPSWNSSPSSRIPALQVRYERMTLENGTPIVEGDFPVVVRNNIQAGIGAPAFVEGYPSNSAVDLADVDTLGVHVGPSIVGNPAVADATLAWAGQNVAPYARSDTYRGGRSLSPAWLASLSNPMTWYEIGDVLLGKVGVDPTIDPLINGQHPGIAKWAVLNGGLSNITTGWSGGSYCHALKRFRISGGGHSGYMGNEVYEIDLLQSSPGFVRINNPSGSLTNPATFSGNIPAAGSNKDVMTDERPKAVHTYGSLASRPNGDYYQMPGGVADDPSTGGFFVKRAFRLRQDTRDWDTVNVGFDASTFDGIQNSVFDPVLDRVMQFGQYRVVTYHADTMVPTLRYTEPAGLPASGRAVYCSTPRLVVLAGFPSGMGESANFGARIFDPDDLTQSWVLQQDRSQSVTGPCGLDWDDVNRRLLLWNGGATVLALRAPLTGSLKTSTWTWETLSVSTSVVTPTSATGTGTWGRFFVDSDLRIAVGYNRVSERLFAFKFN